MTWNREAGVPEKVAFRTKRARRMLERALDHRECHRETRSTATTAASAAVAGVARRSPRTGRQEQREAVGRDGQGMATGAWRLGWTRPGCGAARLSTIAGGDPAPEGAGQGVRAAGPQRLRHRQARGVGLAFGPESTTSGNRPGAQHRWTIGMPKGEVGLDVSMKSVNGMAGTGTSRWRCWPTPGPGGGQAQEQGGPGEKGAVSAWTKS